MRTIREWLQCKRLPMLELEVLLMQVLQQSRAFLYSHPDDALAPDRHSQMETLVQHRIDGTPVAYLTGHREFWSMDLKVTPDTLIPRPETELLVEVTLELTGDRPYLKILDLGTGSGAIALALAKERPQWAIHAVDQSAAALTVAKENAERLGLTQIQWQQSDWCTALLGSQFDLIVSNPPYIDPDDPHLLEGDLRFEPRDALVSADHGYADLIQIIHEAKRALKTGGYLILEHGYQQSQRLQGLLQDAGYTGIHSREDLQGHPRITYANLH